ncbi:unnamed protein product, partial [Ixodes pacificus]
RLDNRLALLAGLVLLHCAWAQDDQRRETTATMLDYCVIGAGPSGLQMAYFLQQSKRNYLVFEKSNMTAVPLFRKHGVLWPAGVARE